MTNKLATMSFVAQRPACGLLKFSGNLKSGRLKTWMDCMDMPEMDVDTDITNEKSVTQHKAM